MNRNLSVLCVLLLLACEGVAEFVFQPGDSFAGQFEFGGKDSENLYELRVHSPVDGSLKWMSDAIGANTGWFTQCHQQTSISCAGGPIQRPIFGALNVSGIGDCTQNSACTGPPNRQPSTGCVQYGCWAIECGCNPVTRRGCWGTDLRGSIVLVQRGSGVGESPVYSCSFDRKLYNAQMAGASAAIVYNNLPYGTIIMASGESQYANLTIPAIFVTQEVGLRLFQLIEDAYPESLEASLTNLSEHSIRLTVDQVTMVTGQIKLTGSLEFRMQDDFGHFLVQGSQIGNQLSITPVCASIEQDANGAFSRDAFCNGNVNWLTVSRRMRAFGLIGELVDPEVSGSFFEHFKGHVLLGPQQEVNAAETVKLRRENDCSPPLSYVADCSPAGDGNQPQQYAQQCLLALDEKGYRVFNDKLWDFSSPLMWNCRGEIFCEGDYLNWNDLNNLARMAVDESIDATPSTPEKCSEGSSNDFFFVGENDWVPGHSLHMCGFGDRNNQDSFCSRLPSTPAFGNPTGWFFNTSCSRHGSSSPCGHSGWSMEDGFASSCATTASCNIDSTSSTLFLYINLPEDGSVSFTYTAHGEQFFDFMVFLINDNIVHDTQTWWQNGRTFRRYTAVLPKGEHELIWSWVKDFSVSSNDDRATLHEIMITGTGRDSTCTPCPPGTCGSGGAGGCTVCPLNSYSDRQGSVSCSACSGKPDQATWSGPVGWPTQGNTGGGGSCPWTCLEGYRSGGSCPAHACCAQLGRCDLPSWSLLSTGYPLPSMQMLSNCLDMIPVDANLARSTLNTIQTMAGGDGAFALYDKPAANGQTDTLGQKILQAVADVSARILDTSSDPITHIPKQSDWKSFHLPLMRAFRDLHVPGLAYIPPRSYQSFAFFLPWTLRADLAIEKAGCQGASCFGIFIDGITAAAENNPIDGRDLLPQLCQCQTCSCQERRSAKQFVGWKVVEMDLDGQGLKDAMTSLQQWANINAMGEDEGSRLRFALSSGQGSFSGAGANAQYVSIVQDTMRSYDRDYPAVSSFHAKDAGGEFGCSFSHRSLAVCELPPCSDEFCHVRLKVQSPDSKEIVIVDVPWTVVNDGGENLSTSISCTDNEVAPFDRNLQCMKETIIYGKKGSSSNTGPAVVKQPSCDGLRAPGGTLPPPLAYPMKLATEDQWSGDCSVRASHFHVVENSFSSASGFIMIDPQTLSKTGVIALRSFQNSQIALHTIIGQLAAAKIDNLLVDVRGNTGGNLCDVYDMAYLLSSKISSPHDASTRFSSHIRQSKLMSDIVYGEDLADISGVGNSYGGNQFNGLCTTSLQQLPNDDELRYVCRNNLSNTYFYSCGQSPACVGHTAWLQNCPQCPSTVKGIRSTWSNSFRQRCMRTNYDGLLRFPVMDSNVCDSGKSKTLYTSKAWSGCASCLQDNICDSSALCGFEKGSLTILSDGRCGGICSLFVKMMEMSNLATIVVPFLAPPPPPSINFVGLMSSATQLWCQFADRNNGNWTLDSSLAIATAYMPLKGQEIIFPSTVAVFANENRQQNNFTTVQHFPSSSPASTCSPILYMEALAASHVCAVSPTAKIVDFLSPSRLFGDLEQCSLPYAAEAVRFCNTSCADEKAICLQYSSLIPTAKCSPSCWSICSAIQCLEGYDRVWIGDRFICYANEFVLDELSYKIGETMGRSAAQEEIRQQYAWKANMSSGGIAALCIFLIVISAIAGRMSVSSQLPNISDLREGSWGGSRVQQMLVAAKDSAAAVVIGIGGAIVTAVQFARDKVTGGIAGAGGGGGDTIHLPSAQEKTDSDYHAL